MKIYLHEISDQDTEFEISQDEAWVVEAVCKADERLEGNQNATPKMRPIRGHISLRKVDEVIVVSGRVETFVELVCSRCANLFQLSCSPSFSGLFCKDPVLAGVAHLQRQGPNETGPARPVGQNKGHARHAHEERNEDEILSESNQDLDITYLSQEFIDLGDVVTEQLQLQVPFQPLCQENCRGICSYCGTDLNIGQCACAKIHKQTPFSVLKDFKL
jgi:uncharacterized protein